MVVRGSGVQVFRTGKVKIRLVFVGRNT